MKTGRKPAGQPSAKVVKISQTVPEPHPERLNSIAKWHIDRAVKRDTVALLQLSVTTNGSVRICGVSIEPEHACLMLDRLACVTEQLKSAASAAQAHLKVSKAV